MKLLRISASLIAIGTMSMLVACGGGGGGGSVPSAPGNGNGAPAPSTTTPTATPAPTSSPTAAPTATSSPSSTVTVSSVILNAGDGYVNGTDNWQTNGVTDADAGDGDTASGGTGSNTVDNIGCNLDSESDMTANNYHVHSFVGLMVNGTEYAVPDAIGMNQPGNQEPIFTFNCAYFIHTHGASGIVHVEDPTINGTYHNVQPPSQYNLQAFLDIWGQSINSIGVAGASGMPAIYVGSVTGTNPATGDDLVSAYTLSTAAPSSILLSHHTAIWLVYGSLPTAGLPQIDFRIST